MSRPKVLIHNIETDEIITREMNDAELAQWELDQTEAEQRKAEAEAKAAQKATLLDRLGITEDEVKLLLA
jgi:lipoate synthase